MIAPGVYALMLMACLGAALLALAFGYRSYDAWDFGGKLWLLKSAAYGFLAIAMAWLCFFIAFGHHEIFEFLT